MGAQAEGRCTNFFNVFRTHLVFFRENGWHNSSRKVVSNKDLFSELDETISELERCHIDVGGLSVRYYCMIYNIFRCSQLLTMMLKLIRSLKLRVCRGYTDVANRCKHLLSLISESTMK